MHMGVSILFMTPASLKRYTCAMRVQPAGSSPRKAGVSPRLRMLRGKNKHMVNAHFQMAEQHRGPRPIYLCVSTELLLSNPFSNYYGKDIVKPC